MNKPKLLYHASPNKNIELFEPRAETVRDKKEGSVIFTTPSQAYASTFLVPADDSWTRRGRFGDIWYLVVSDRKRFQSLDKGGSIYSFPPDNFKYDSEKGMGHWEWISKKATRPISKTNYQSGLEAMIDNGVQVYFVDKKTFNRITHSEDHGNRILMNLSSENQKIGKNINLIKPLTLNRAGLIHLSYASS